MVSLDLICRFCLIVAEDDSKKLLIRLTEEQKIKFEELTKLQLPLTSEFPLNVCTDCSDHLENFHFFKSQLIRKQNDLNLFLTTISSQQQQEDDGLLQEAIQDDFIEFDEEIEIFDETNELIAHTSDDIQTENFIEDDDNLISEQLLQEEEEKLAYEPPVVCREELRFEKPNPQLVLYPRDVIKNPEQITPDLESPLIDTNDKNLFKCSICNINLKSKLSYEKHMQDSHEQNFICPTCGNIYAKKRDLRSHLRSHNFVKKYKCTFVECDKAFRHQHHLKNHLRVHEKNSPFKCNECNKCFKQKHSLTLHLRKHDKDFIECTDCKSQFIRPAQLKKHIENKLCDGTFKPYVTRTKKNKD